MRRPLIVCLLSTVSWAGCRRASPDRTPSGACAAARGEWIGDDIDAPDASVSERDVARAMVRMNRWRISDDAFVTVQSRTETRETLRVVEEDGAHCLVDLAVSGDHRRLQLEPRADHRLRVTGPGMRTAMLLRAAP